MGRWTDLAEWGGPTPNQSGNMTEIRGVVVHIAQGTYQGTISWQRNPESRVSSHFIVALDGKITQMVDTTETAWTQRAGNGHWLSVENAGYVPNPLTAYQVEANARLLARAHQRHGVPLQLADSPDDRGLGHHSMGAKPGSPADWGHSACPGPAIIAQKGRILARAKEIINGRDGSFLMALTDSEQTELLGAVRQLKSLIHDGKRGPGLSDTAGGGVPIAYLVRTLEELRDRVAALEAPAPVAVPDAVVDAMVAKLVERLPALRFSAST